MATIRRRDKKFQVQIRRNGHSPITQTFSHHCDAKVWARETERTLDRGYRVQGGLTKATLGDVLERYCEEITVHKKGKLVEQRRINRLLRDPISQMGVNNLSSHMIASFRDRRKQDGLRACAYDLVIIRHALEIARKEWGVVLAENPVDQVRKPPASKPRHRRLEPGEYEALKAANQQCRVSYLWPLINLAIETGMRRGELLGLTWSNVDMDQRTVFLADTKNGSPRTVPLSHDALSVLNHLPKTSDSVFRTTEVAVRQAWDRLVRRAGIVNLHFHDLRHEAISRFFEMGLSVPEVALISGHKDYRMLARYTHLRAEDVGKKLERLCALSTTDVAECSE